MKHQRFASLETPAFSPQVAAVVKVKDGDRTVLLSFSSEISVLRDTSMGPAYEVLGHDPGEVNLSRFNSASAPVLRDHRRDVDSMVGTVVSAWIEGRRAHAIVRLSDAPEGSTARLALALALNIGQRRSDLVLFGKRHMQKGLLVFTQQKGKGRNPVRLKILIVPELKRIIGQARPAT